MAEKLTIQFSAKGAGALKKTLEDLHLANVKLTKGNAAFVREQKKLQNNLKKSNGQWVKYHRNVGKAGGITTKFGQTMSAVRSKLLIYAFAVGLVTTGMKKLFDKFIEQEAAEKRLEAAIGKTSTALLNQASALQQVTIFGDEAIIGVQSLIGAFIKDEKQIKLATKATLDLAAAKGMDLKTAGDLVSKTLGSTTNALSRYGIQVEGNVGSTQRLESLTTNISRVFGGQATAATETLGGALQQMSNAFGDASEAVGQAFAPIIMKLAPILTEAAQAAKELVFGWQESELETAIRQIEEMGGNADDLKLKLAEAEKVDLEDKLFKTNNLIELSVGHLHEMGVLQENLDKSKEEELRLTQEIGAETARLGDVEKLRALAKGKNFDIEIKNGQGILEGMTEQEKFIMLQARADLEHLDNLKGQLEAQKNLTKENQDNLDLSLKYEAALKKIEALQNKIKGTVEDTSDAWEGMFSQIMSSEKVLVGLADALGSGMSQSSIQFNSMVESMVAKTQDLMSKSTDDAIAQAAIFKEVMGEMTSEILSMVGQAVIQAIDSQIQAYKQAAQAQKQANAAAFKEDMERLKSSRLYQKMNASQQKRAEQKLINQKEKLDKEAEKKANKRMKEAFRIKQAMNIASVFMDTGRAIMAVAPNVGMMAAMKVMGALQVALILAQKPPKMEQGGLIGGRRHSQGGTMIEAEAGEFVVSRQGVESVGIETLNRINEGGGSSNINIVFEGNVLSEDFIVDEAIPKIKEALRRGEDIGIS